MSIDQNLNDYREALKLLQGIIDRGVKSRDELIEELHEDLKNKKENTNSVYPLLDDVRVLQDGEPCNHIGCRNHISHPCEGCGRIACKGTAETSKDKHVI